MIEIDGLSFVYNDRKIFSNLSLKMYKNENTLILGDNGCGKTTLCNLIAGILVPEIGSIKIDGVDISEWRRRKIPKVGILFQNPDNQFIRYKVIDEIRLTYKYITKERECFKSANDVINAFELNNISDRLINTLSGGEKQKLALACVMAYEPEFLILDEPFAHLDPLNELSIRNIIRKLSDKITVIEVSQKSSIMDDFNRVIYIENQIISFDGDIGTFKKSILFHERINIIKNKLQSKYKYTPETCLDSEILSESKNICRRNIIEIENLSFSYGREEKTLDNINLSVKEGESLGVIGPNSSGKSTLMDIIADILKPDEGVINKDLNDFAYIFQFPERNIFCETVFDEIAFWGKNVNAEDIEFKVKNIMALVGLDYDKFAYRNPFLLSYGEKRKVSIASSLALSPDLILLDEPDVSLSEFSKQSICNTILKLKKAGKIFFIISHDIEFLYPIVDKVVIINKGITECYGTFTECESKLNEYGYKHE